MNGLKRSLAVGFVSAGLVAGGSAIMSAQEYPAPYNQGFPGQPEGLRALVDRAQNDLRMAEEQEHQKEGQRERYEHAQGHLSTFDRDLTRGKFGKGELDKSIDGIRDILKHNVLTPTSRDALRHDLDDLMMVRNHRY